MRSRYPARRIERRFRQPHETRFDGLRRDGAHFRGRQNRAARHVDIDIELQRDGLPGGCDFKIAVHRGDADDFGAAAAQSVGDAIADADDARGDGAGEAAEILAVAQHGLHRQAERTDPIA